MSRFWDNAASILEAAESSRAASSEAAEWTILLGPECGVRLMAASDWPLESLLAHHGAQMAFRVRHRDDRVLVEGRAGSRACLLESAKPERAARLLLRSASFSLRCAD